MYILISYHKSRKLTDTLLSVLGRLNFEDWGPSVPLDSLKLIQSVRVDELLALLNRKVPKPFVTAAQSPDDAPRIAYTQSPSTPEILRVWIDEWLDSGRTKNGDDPQTRNIEKAKQAADAAYEFSKRGRIVLLPDGKSLGLWIAKYDPEPVSTLRPLVGPRPEDYAREHLVFFLLSDLRFRLAKCRNEHCGKYFLLTRTNQLYKRGTLCSTCGRGRSQESAKDATATARKVLRGELWASVAKRFSKQIAGNVSWYQDDALKKDIAAYLNSTFADSEPFKTAYKSGISGKWIANVKNWKPITKAAKGGK
jgi:hypothetical protein